MLGEFMKNKCEFMLAWTLGLSVVLGLAYIIEDRREGKYYIKGVVVRVGQCAEDVGPDTCISKVHTTYGERFWKTVGPVMVGQTLYKLCWKEDDGDYCEMWSETRVYEDLEVR